jgi:short-subunit dehydrogenase
MTTSASGVVITGASAGVGRATAITFGRRGWRVGLIARGRDGLDGACRDVERAGGTAVALPADVADADAIERQAQTFEEACGPFDVWINCAMATIFAPFAQMTADEFRRVTEVTYLGQVHGTMAALKRMRPRDRGTIVAVGSALAYRSIPLQSAYCGAKAAVRGFMDSLRSELVYESSAIRLTMVHLPAVNTPQFDWARNRLPYRPRPLAPIFQPEAVAEQIYDAAHEAPRELWIGLPTVKAILGTMAIPGYLDRNLARSAYGGQEAQERDDPHRPDNLFEPVAGDHGAHGRFDREARATVAGFSAATLRTLLGGAAGLAVVGGTALALRKKG